MKYIIAMLLVLVFVACSTKIPVATKYIISPKVSIDTNSALNFSQCKKHSLKVMQSFSSNILMSKEMYYVQDQDKIYPYSVAEWAIAPNKLVSDAYFMMLRDLDIFQFVQNAKSRTKAPLALEIKVEDFMQYYKDDNTASYVIVSINLTILDTATLKVLGTKLFTSKLDVEKLNANGGVVGLNKALANVLTQSAIWLSEACDDK